MGKIKQWIVAHKVWSIVIASVLVVAISLSITLPLALRHKHTYSDWSADATYHWHACTGKKCDEITDKAEHTFGDDNKCTVCQKTKSTLTLNVEDFTYGSDYEVFQASWIADYSGGCEYDTSIYSYEYFQYAEDGETKTSLGETLPKNAGNYQVVVTYDGDEEQGYLPTQASDDFTINKRELAFFVLFVDDSLIPTEKDETLKAYVWNVSITSSNSLFLESSISTTPASADKTILAGDEVNAKVTFKSLNRADGFPRIANCEYPLNTKVREGVVYQEVELDSANYCLKENAYHVAKLYFTKKLTKGEATNIAVTNNTANFDLYYSFTFSIEAGQKAKFTLTRTATGDASYKTLAYFAPTELASQLFLNGTGTALTKEVVLDNTAGETAISTTIIIRVDPNSGVTELNNTIKVDYQIVEE